jgi:hypothetical protein
VPECSDIAALLQLEADLVDAARCVDREHERKIGCGLRGRRSRGKHDKKCKSRSDGAPDPGAPPIAVKANIHGCRQNKMCTIVAGVRDHTNLIEFYWQFSNPNCD